MMLPTRLRPFLAAISTALLLNACVEPVVKPSHPLVVQAPDSERGVVVTRIISNDTRLNEFFSQWNQFTVQRVDSEDKEIFVLDAVESGWSNTALFVGVLPAGDYEARSLRATDQHIYSSAWLQQVFPASLRRFHVDGARYTDLGALVYQSVHGPDRSSDFTMLYREEDHINTVALVDELFPTISARVTNKSALGWQHDDAAQEHELAPQLRQLIHAAAIPNGAPQAGPDGQILVPARLGQIHARDAQGHWQSYDTGFRFALHHVSHAAGVGYIASGESGLILHAEDLSGPWQVSPGGIKANGSTLGLFRNTDGYWYQALRVGEEASSLDWISLNQRTFGRTHHEMFRSRDIRQPQWSAVALPQQQAEWALQTDRFYLLATEDRLFRYQGDNTWAETGRAPHDRIALGDDGQLYAYTEGLVNRLGTLASGDGHTWHEAGQLYFTSLPQRLDGVEYVLARPPLSLNEASTTLPALEAALFTRTGTNTAWQKTIPVPPACTLEASLHVLHQQLWARCSETQLYRLAQEDWILEWQPALDAQLFRQHRIEQTAYQL